LRRAWAFTPTQAAISWLAHRPGITAPIASATSKTQLQELMAGVELQLDAEARKTLDEASAGGRHDERRAVHA